MEQGRENIVKSVANVTDKDWTAWAKMRGENPALISPYFHPDYARLISPLVSDVRIVCAYQGGENIGFLAVQGGKFARPAGMPLSDFHGLIKPAGSALNYNDILEGTGIGAYHFAASIDTHDIKDVNILARQTTSALNIDTSADDWRAGLDSSYKRHMKSTRRRIRKAQEDIGERRFVFASHDQDVFDQLMAWKFKKFEDTGKYNVLSVDWTMQFIKDLWMRNAPNNPDNKDTNADSSHLRCDMHALYFGDKLAAVDLGLTDGPIFHSWIVAYNDDFQNFAPGIQLLEGLIDAAQDLGYSRIDMGAGLDGYKRHYATHGHEVAAGYVPVQGMAGHMSTLYGKTERWGQSSLKDAPGKLRRRYSQIKACETSRPKQAKAMFEAVKMAPKR